MAEIAALTLEQLQELYVRMCVLYADLLHQYNLLLTELEAHDIKAGFKYRDQWL